MSKEEQVNNLLDLLDHAQEQLGCMMIDIYSSEKTLDNQWQKAYNNVAEAVEQLTEKKVEKKKNATHRRKKSRNS